MNTIELKTLANLPAAAKQFLAVCEGKTIFAFTGLMGAGKTTFIKAICEELGVKDTISSPTFSLVNEYRAGSGQKIYHFDFYRIRNISEAYDMGYEDYLYSGALCFIEWPEMIDELLPEAAVKVEIKVVGEERIITFD